MKKADDFILIKKAKEGDSKAFRNIVENHKSRVFTIAFRIVKNKEEAEEIAQDAFLNVFNSISNFKGDSQFSTWLYKITYNLSISHLRKKKRDIVNIDEILISDFEIFETYHDFSLLEKEEQKSALEAAINKLSEEEATIITLYYLQEISIEEISEITGNSKSNVKVILFRSRKKLFSIIMKSKETVLTLY